MKENRDDKALIRENEHGITTGITYFGIGKELTLEKAEELVSKTYINVCLEVNDGSDVTIVIGDC